MKNYLDNGKNYLGNALNGDTVYSRWKNLGIARKAIGFCVGLALAGMLAYVGFNNVAKIEQIRRDEILTNREILHNKYRNMKIDEISIPTKGGIKSLELLEPLMITEINDGNIEISGLGNYCLFEEAKFDRMYGCDTREVIVRGKR